MHFNSTQFFPMFSTTLLDGFLEGKLFFAASITILGIAIGFWRVRSLETDFPTVNAYSNDFAHKKAHRAFLVNARQLIIEGFQKVRKQRKKSDRQIQLTRTTLSSTVLFVLSRLLGLG